jgi:hypothetical protein
MRDGDHRRSSRDWRARWHQPSPAFLMIVTLLLFAFSTAWHPAASVNPGHSARSLNGHAKAVAQLCTELVPAPPQEEEKLPIPGAIARVCLPLLNPAIPSLQTDQRLHNRPPPAV